jgi:nucleoside-diphosphate-sugar epimerase
VKALVTGGTGTLGRFIVEDLLDAGYAVTVAGRTAPAENTFSRPAAFRPLDMEPNADHAALLAGADVLIHAAFHHAPGRYRGGEGDDPETFTRLNRDGSIALFKAAKTAGVKRCVFLSSRAVYGDWPAGIRLFETMECRPDTLYGEVKRDAETALASLAGDDFVTASLRVTGVYGAARPGWHKWQKLFDDYRAGRPIEPRAGTEVHGRDMAAAVRLMLAASAEEISGQAFNVSDLLVDRRDLLWLVNEAAGTAHPLPKRARSLPNVMDVSKIEALGWRPGGVTLLRKTVRALA